VNHALAVARAVPAPDRDPVSPGTAVDHVGASSRRADGVVPAAGAKPVPAPAARDHVIAGASAQPVAPATAAQAIVAAAPEQQIVAGHTAQQL
jgi:hypothetical protein